MEYKVDVLESKNEVEIKSKQDLAKVLAEIKKEVDMNRKNISKVEICIFEKYMAILDIWYYKRLEITIFYKDNSIKKYNLSIDKSLRIYNYTDVFLSFENYLNRVAEYYDIESEELDYYDYKRRYIYFFDSTANKQDNKQETKKAETERYNYYDYEEMREIYKGKAKVIKVDDIKKLELALNKIIKIIEKDRKNIIRVTVYYNTFKIATDIDIAIEYTRTAEILEFNIIEDRIIKGTDKVFFDFVDKLRNIAKDEILVRLKSALEDEIKDIKVKAYDIEFTYKEKRYVVRYVQDSPLCHLIECGKIFEFEPYPKEKEGYF